MNTLEKKIASEVAKVRRITGESLRVFCKRFNKTPPTSVKLNPPMLMHYEKGRFVPRSDVYLKLKSMMPIKKE